MTKLNLQFEQLERIRQLAKLGENRTFHFLGFALDLETSEFYDDLKKNVIQDNGEIKNFSILLANYSLAREIPKKGRLIKFKDLPGGCAFEQAFIQTAINPIAQAFDNNPLELIEAAKMLGGKLLDYGDVSVEVPALEGIPIVIILWTAQEFPAEANLLFDESASSFLDTESLAVLGQLTTCRILEAHSILRKNIF